MRSPRLEQVIPAHASSEVWPMQYEHMLTRVGQRGVTYAEVVQHIAPALIRKDHAYRSRRTSVSTAPPPARVSAPSNTSRPVPNRVYAASVQTPEPCFTMPARTVPVPTCQPVPPRAPAAVICGVHIDPSAPFMRQPDSVPRPAKPCSFCKYALRIGSRWHQTGQCMAIDLPEFERVKQEWKASQKDRVPQRMGPNVARYGQPQASPAPAPAPQRAPLP